MSRKILGRKNYGSIPHLPNSRMGPADKSCNKGQMRIACIKPRDKHDEIIVQEKLDGSNVGIYRVNGQIFPLTRAGYHANTSPYEQHWKFAKWVNSNYERFYDLLEDGERIVGEWLIQAHGTRYDLPHEPFVAFDLMVEGRRFPYDEFLSRIDNRCSIPHLLYRGREAFSVESALTELGKFGYHGALDKVEGAVWRVERDNLIDGKSNRCRIVDFLVKYVRTDKQDGIYLPTITGKEPYWNTYL